jgi:plasmid maintenance system killer protein
MRKQLHEQFGFLNQVLKSGFRSASRQLKNVGSMFRHSREHIRERPMFGECVVGDESPGPVQLKALDVAGRIEDLSVPAGNRLGALKGDRAGRHSIRINDLYRVTFRWEQGHAHEVRVEDYH